MKSAIEELEEDFSRHRYDSAELSMVNPLGLTKREMAGLTKSIEHKRKLQERIAQIKKENGLS